ncbi:hypothetical protein PoB_000047700 [Plakobranchus ocellatus]|uniref:Uncharacterized protein n=1 Tax=Plakobranchus ocellatus TaxID=259542 RepID=A0AAV3XVU6_9GAST|nr:hypothetical protein PoB_000047700 [Plakobranchus ocellatus]
MSKSCMQPSGEVSACTAKKGSCNVPGNGQPAVSICIRASLTNRASTSAFETGLLWLYGSSTRELNRALNRDSSQHPLSPIIVQFENRSWLQMHLTRIKMGFSCKFSQIAPTDL